MVLWATRGFSEATALALAGASSNICGVHLDRRQNMAHVDENKAKIAGHAREVLFFNVNAAGDAQRAYVVGELRAAFDQRAGERPYVRVMLHSLAFGTLKPFLAE